MPRAQSDPAIRLRGVRQNNLKGFDLDLPLGKLVVITGLSGSGKSSLAFDTLYAEGQRRYIETFSPYARQFFDRMDKPRVDSIEGIPPAIAIEQRNTVRSTRSTVGTLTEICDHMKALWPHLAQLHCRQCGQPVRQEPPQTVWKTLIAEDRGQKAEVLITFDLPLSQKLSLDESLALIAKQGYQRLLLNSAVVRIDQAANPSAICNPQSAITVVQDRLRLTPSSRARFIEACEQAYHFGKGRLALREVDGVDPRSAFRAPRFFSSGLHCAACDLEYRAPSPALFSFNHPLGACPACKGFGRIISIDYLRAIPDRRKTLREGAVKPWQSGMSAECQRDLLRFCRTMEVPIDVPFQDLSREHQDWILLGDPDYGKDEEHEWPRAWYGVKGYFRWLESKAYKMHVRVLLSRYRAYTPCPDCHGARLNPDALLYQFTHNAHPLSLAGFYALPIQTAFELVDKLAREATTPHSALPAPRSALAHPLSEVHARLRYLNDIGLGYLTLDRATRTLSGGETERVNLAACLGTRLVNTLFVLDEPSVGLHPRDTERLVRILEALRDEGNTVVVVEHERRVMEAADQIIDLGPGHGAAGGELVFQGTWSQILKSKRSITGHYLGGASRIEIPRRRPTGCLNPPPPTAPQTNRKSSAVQSRQPQPHSPSDFGLRTSDFPSLHLSHANRHNLKNLTVDIPLNRLVCISGVSGSGKSTLIREVLLPELQQRLGTNPDAPKASDRLDEETESPDPQFTQDAPRTTQQPIRLTGAEHLSKVVLVDQSLLGKTPRSNPAVYSGAFDHIRELFAQSEAARRQGLNASAFSFNSAQGQCERCRGAGFEKVEMQFLSDVFIRCPDCNGRRYREHILEVRLQKAEGGGRKTEDRGEGSGADPDSGSRKTPHETGALSIADLLESTVDEAVGFLEAFADSKPAQRAVASLKWLQEVGLGYLQLGQPINTLSGGESQRLKLVRHLAESSAAVPAATPNSPTKDSRGGCATLFILDEPTTGLHFEDVRVLLQALQRLVNAGHSLIVIEHNLDVLKSADWIIDLGPEAGHGGGQLVVAGAPETVAACPESHTGRFLAQVLNSSPSRAKGLRKAVRKPPTQR